jgi:hypothetical protein
MALYALARFVEQRLEAEVRAYRNSAEIIVLPTVDTVSVSPADFSRTQDLIKLAYKSSRRVLAASASRPPAISSPRRRGEVSPREGGVAALQLLGSSRVAAPAA